MRSFLNDQFMPISYFHVTNHPQIQWLETIIIEPIVLLMSNLDWAQLGEFLCTYKFLLYEFIFVSKDLSHGFSPLKLFAFGPDNSLFVCQVCVWVLSVHCRLCISISGLYLLDAGYKPPPQCDNPNVSRR